MLLMWWQTTIVTLGFLWSVTTQPFALEMAVALPVPSMANFQYVKVDYNTMTIMATHLFWMLISATAITCPPLSNLTNGSVSYSNVSGQSNSYAFNVEVTYKCDIGFFLVGNNTRTCNGDGSKITGSFDGEASTCDCE